MPSFM
jgi:NAD(P)H-flavin reductase